MSDAATGGTHGGAYKAHREIVFEAAIEASLLAGGYVKGDPADYDPEIAIDRRQSLSWLQASQPDVLQKLRQQYGPEAEATFFKQLARNLDQFGSLHVLRNGFTIVPAIHVKMCQFKPASGMNPTIAAHYAANILSVMRQVRYNPRQPAKALDLALFINGVPIASAELKSPTSGQTYRHAEKQYRSDRSPTESLILEFRRRCVAHFCVDPDNVSVTTRLSGSGTRFLPFNKGFEGGAGNPLNPEGCKTAYLWEQVWSRDVWLDIIGRFVTLETKKKVQGGRKITVESLIFPRYHQLDAVLTIEADAKATGAGQDYLIQHSAGSGKSNTIAWTAHRLSTLHDAMDRPIFRSVIVVTDRVVLDRQLQDTIKQFEQTAGVVRRIDGTSAQLAQALKDGAKVIVSTIHKFSVIVDALAGLRDHRFAVIIDEAHSSQSGQRADDLVKVLTSHEEDEEPETIEDLLLEIVAKRADRANLSFLAFTATPKHKTMQRFGRKDADGMPKPFHLYPMRQAIEEDFILDVLKNYMTYKAYYELEKRIEDDPEFEARKGQKAVASFVSFNAYNIAQKVQVIVEHFRTHVARLLDGKAKAMVVTGSRRHAVRYYHAIRKYIAEQGYEGLRPLVAYSGAIDEPEGSEPLSEAELNGFAETELPDRFEHGDADGEYHLLVVAEKYQTGFDQPLLCAMYVDRKLKGLQAVQTLSRLNRTHPGKDKVFVLDFGNEVEEIQEAFKPYYEATSIDQPSDPHQVYTLLQRIQEPGYIDQGDVDAFAEVFFTADFAKEPWLRGRIETLIDAACERFAADDDEDQREEFRGYLAKFLRFYAFISSITNLGDGNLEKHYQYGRLLLAKLPRRDGGEQVEITDEEVRLAKYRLKETFQGQASLTAGDTKVLTGAGDLGGGLVSEEERETLSQIIERFNERFGTDFTDDDLTNFRAAGDAALQDEEIVAQARANPYDVFAPVFEEMFMSFMRKEIMRRSGQTQRDMKTVSWLSSETEVKKMAASLVARRVYREARSRDADA